MNVTRKRIQEYLQVGEAEKNIKKEKNGWKIVSINDIKIRNKIE